MPKNVDCITIIITLEGIEKIKTEKNDNKEVWGIFLSARPMKTVTNTVMASRF